MAMIQIARMLVLFALLLVFAVPVAVSQTVMVKPQRDPNQPIDEEYTKKIAEYTTEKFFNSPLTDFLPASKTVPTPKVVLGDIAGAPGKLPYAEEVYKYMRLLEKASPRVKVFSIGTTEEGREMIAVAVSSEANIAQLATNRERLAKLADPRTIGMNDDEAEKIVAASVPVYYITGTIHSTETGSPTALMELAYRLTVDESEYYKNIRNNLVTLITPVVEVDGRNRVVDVYNWHLANPGKNWPNMVYWGHYVAHDNNRDAMAMSLKLTQNVLNTYKEWKVQVLHDLHESVPYLYDNTVGDQPYNAWLDPILTDEWQIIGWNNVSEMTKFGMPGVFTHGTFDTWSPSYLMFIAASHNGISRLYETFGNAGADTLERTLSPADYSRRWYKQNPPLPKAMWSQRNNNNYQESALIVSLGHFAANGKYFLRNFYLKSKNSILKPKQSGPAAYVFPADDPRPGGQAQLLRLLQAQGCEVHRTTAPATITLPAKKADKDKKEADKPVTKEFPAGSFVVRMDQPYSRIADMMLDLQYWAPDDPQKDIYDDTAWSFGELGNVRTARVTDAKFLDTPMEMVKGPVLANGGVMGTGKAFIVNHNADNELVSLRYRLKAAQFETAEVPFEAAGQKFNRGSFIIRGVTTDEMFRVTSELGLKAFATDAVPTVKTHAVKAPRIAIMHTWLSTQDEGWWRLEFDRLKVPYDYISTQDVSANSNLNAKYDVIVFAPVGRGSQQIIEGMPMYGNPIPWKTTTLTPNIGKIASTDDMRPGLGLSGVKNLRDFVSKGGLFITASDTSEFAIASGMTKGVLVQPARSLRVTGSVLRSKPVDSESPIMYGYGPEDLSVFCAGGPILSVSNFVGGGRRGGGRGGSRLTGRGSADDQDLVQNRTPDEIPDEPKVNPWELGPVKPEDMRNGVNVIPPDQRPRVILRWSDGGNLLISGLLEGGGEIAQKPAIVDVPLDSGHVILYSNLPFWRAETQGSYFLVFNAILNFDNLNAGRKLAER